MTVSFVSYNSENWTNGNDKITLPADVTVGDLGVFYDFCSGGTASAPDGWTTIVAVGSVVVSFKILGSGDAGLSITGMSSSNFSRMMVAAWRSDAGAFSGVSVGGATIERTNGNPAEQTATASQGNSPILVLGGYESGSDVDPRSFSPAEDAELTSTATLRQFIKYKIYQSTDTPLDHLIDMADEGNNNNLFSAWLALTEGAAATTFTKTGSLDAVLQRVGLTRTATLDAMLQRQRALDTALDAILARSRSAGVSLDAALQKGVSLTALLDAALQRGVTTSAFIDAAIQRALSVSVALDAIIDSGLVAGTRTVNLDAVLQAARQASVDLDAAIQRAQMLSVDLDAVLSRQGTATVALDALFAKTRTATVTLDALLAGRFLTTAEVDAIFQRAMYRQIYFDAIIVGPWTAGSAASASYSEIAAATGSWSAVAAGAGAWSDVAAASASWSEVPAGTDGWNPN